MSAMAGALDVELEKIDHYCLGQGQRAATASDIGQSVRLMHIFSVNSNPYGPSPRVWEALHGAPLDRYPDREALALRRVLAERLDVL